MRRFILRENIKHFHELLKNEQDPVSQDLLIKMLAEAQHELSRLESIWLWTCPKGAVPFEVGAAVEAALDAIIERSKADFGSVQLWNDDTQGLHLIAHRNFDTALAEQFALIRDGVGTTCEAAMISRAEVIIEDVEKEPGLEALLSWTRPAGIRAIHTTPIFDRHGKFIGVFSTQYCAPRSLAPAQRRRNGDHAEYLGAILERTR